MSLRQNISLIFIHRDRPTKKLRAATNRSSIKSTTEISIPNLRTRAIRKVSCRGKVVFVGDIRRERAKRSEIDKAHVLHGGWESLAGSKYGGTQLSPPNCRDNATDGFDRNPYPLPPLTHHPFFPLSSRSLSLTPTSLFFALCTAISSFFRRSCRFSRILPRASFLPVNSIRRHATPCVRFHLV